MILNKRIKSIIIISIISAIVVCGYYLVSYLLKDNSLSSYYDYTDSEVEYIMDSQKIEVYIFTPEFMFKTNEKEDSNTEEGFSLPSSSKLGERFGAALRELIVNKNRATDNGKRADEYETVINGFMESLSSVSNKISFYHDEKGEYKKKFNVDKNTIVFKTKEKTVTIPYDDFFVCLDNGKKYAFNKTKVINVINLLNGKPEIDSPSLVALSGYDTDGDTVSTITGNPFIFPAVTLRYDVEYMRVKNQKGTFSILQDVETGNFYFENALTLSYDSEKFSKMLMSGIYMLSNGKVKDPVSLEEYGLADEEKATAVIEILTKDGVLHKVIIGNETLDGKGYYAKYYNKDHIYILDDEIENGILLSAGDFLKSNLVHTVSSVEGIYSVDDINVNFLKENKKLHVVLLEDGDDDGSQVFSIWKILSPEELIPIGKEFGNPNSSAFTDFIQSAANLTTEKIVEYEMTDIPLKGTVVEGISEEALSSYKKETIEGFSEEVLEKYGLASPRLDVSYSYPYTDKNKKEFKIVSRVLISEEQEDGNYYAYSYLYTYNSDGKITEILSTGCITTLSLSTVDWLDWDVMDFNNQFLYKNFVYNLNWIEVEYQNEIYRFNVDGSVEKEDVNAVTLIHNGTSKDIDVQTFKFMYSSILLIYMVDNYDIADEKPNMMCRITINAGGGSTEMIFYRVTNTKAYYTLNGEGKYYVKAKSVFDFLNKYQRVLNGEILTRDD